MTRAFRCVVFSALLALCASPALATGGWSPTFSNGAVAFTNTNHTALNTPKNGVGIAVDVGGNKIWIWNPVANNWNGDVLANQNPATGTGGFSISAVTSGTVAVYPGWSGLTNGGESAVINGGSSSFLYGLPSGFTAWSSSLTWNPSAKGANIVLTDGNLTATDGASGWQSVLGSVGYTTGKYYFEVTFATWSGDGDLITGIGNASTTLSNYVGSSTNSAGWQGIGSGYEVPNITSYLVSGSWHSALGVTARTAGKAYFELTCTFGSAANIVAGVSTSALTPARYPGSDGTSLGWDLGFGPYYGSGNLFTWTAPSSGAAIGVAVDFIDQKIWFYDPGAGKWNNDVIGNQNPATNTGGLTNFAIGGTTLMPAAAFYAWGGTDSIVVNEGATSFSNTIPSGFVAWNAVSVGSNQFLLMGVGP